ncbi:hypothetical protein X975_01722, partial [Stegodyphus mimosarum]
MPKDTFFNCSRMLEIKMSSPPYSVAIAHFEIVEFVNRKFVTVLQNMK